ncbi:MAG: hypothetical protein JXB62_04410 [Pirellulales bacterium]|nr:hypothetical protein [Pirellulales bacterium]
MPNVSAGDSPGIPAVSSYAPAEDLAGQVVEYIQELEDVVATEQDYDDSEDKIAKAANTLVVIALALGLHDQDSQFKANAAALVKAAQELAKTSDFTSAKAGVAALKTAVAQGGDGPELKWEPVADLPSLMKQVPLIHTKLKRYTTARRFESKAKDTAGYSAAIAAIAQGTVADTREAKSPEQVQQWYAFSVQMRQAAGAVNAAVRALDESACTEAMNDLQKSCDDCHAVFHVVEE